MTQFIDPRLTKLTYEPANFREHFEDVGEPIWAFLCRPDNVVRMETASYLERAAVEPLGPILLQEFGEEIAEDRTKQMIGHMTRQVMEHLDYELVQKGATIAKGMFTTGARYQRAEEKRDRSMRITREQREAWLKKTANTPFNRWLKAKVSKEDGTLDLNLLYAVARDYGLRDIERYKHLNPGQQRMNIGNRLRALVPPDEYSGS